MIKLSFRSQLSFPCNEFAADFFNGGGHLNASGGEYYGTFEEALRIYADGLKAYESKLKQAINPWSSFFKDQSFLFRGNGWFF